MGRVTIQMSASEEFKQAVSDYCKENDIIFSQETRNFWAKKMKRPDLAESQSVGRPKKREKKK